MEIQVYDRLVYLFHLFSVALCVENEKCLQDCAVENMEDAELE